MPSICCFITPRDFVIEVHRHGAAGADFLDLIDDRRVARNAGQSDEDFREAALGAVAAFASRYDVPAADIVYDQQGEDDENALLGGKQD